MLYLRKARLARIIIVAILLTITSWLVPIGLKNNEVSAAANDSDIKYTDGITGGAIYFDESTGTITDCDKTVTGAIIPEKINGVTVTSIGDYAFQACNSLTNITIPGSLTSIGDYAFVSCDSLTNITIPDSVTEIGYAAFKHCDSLTSITIPGGVTSIEDYAFEDCSKLTSIDVSQDNKNYASQDGVFFDKSKVTLIQYPIGNARSKYEIPNSVISIKPEAFSGCDNLTNVTIPDSVTEIGYGAFWSCSKLTSITIPSSVAEIKYNVFSYCDSLTSIDVSQDNKNYASQDGVLFNKSKTTLIQYPIGNIRSKYEIPNSVTSIEASAFVSCDSLTNITIPDSVTSIGASAFENCDSLTNITIPDSVTSIWDYAFRNCGSLTNITIPDSVTSIGDSAFWNCSELTSITIPNSVRIIGEDAFYNCNYGDIIIYGYTGSHAEYYAKKYDISFISLGEAIDESIDLKYTTVSLDNLTYNYNGKQFKPIPKVVLDDKILIKDTDYTVTYSNNINAGTAKVTITGKGKYVGTVEKTFTIKPVSLKTATVSLDTAFYSYNGEQQKPEPEVVFNGKVLERDKDYSLSYGLNKDSGDGYIYITGEGNYIGTIEKIFTIEPANIKNVTVSLDASSYSYNGKQLEPIPKVDDDGKILVEDTDYSLSYDTNKYPGYGYIYITGEGNYTGEITKSFKIVPQATTAKLSLYGHDDIKVTWSKVPQASGYKVIYRKAEATKWTTKGYYTGTSVSISNLTDGTKYEVAVIPYKTVNETRYYADYTPSSIYTLKSTTTKLSLYGYDDVNISWSKVEGASGYKVSYRRSGSSSWTTKGYYTGTSVNLSNLTDGKKYEVIVKPYAKVGSTKYYAPYKTASIYTLKKISTPSVTKYSSTRVKVSWSNITGESGYQISKSTSKTGTNIVYTYKTTSAKSKTISATKGKTYYYKVRAYKTVDGKNIYGPWSYVKSYKLG